jgi:hypothetical protein
MAMLHSETLESRLLFAVAPDIAITGEVIDLAWRGGTARAIAGEYDVSRAIVASQPVTPLLAA